MWIIRIIATSLIVAGMSGALFYSIIASVMRIEELVRDARRYKEWEDAINEIDGGSSEY